MQKITASLLCLTAVMASCYAGPQRKMRRPYRIKSVCTYTQDKPNHIKKHCMVYIRDRQGHLMGRREVEKAHPGLLKELVLQDIDQNVSTFSWATDKVAAPCNGCSLYDDQWGGDR